MAVPKSKKSRSKGGMHRSHDHLDVPSFIIDKSTGECRRPHHIHGGFYNGRKVINTKTK